MSARGIGSTISAFLRCGVMDAHPSSVMLDQAHAIAFRKLQRLEQRMFSPGPWDRSAGTPPYDLSSRML